NYEVFRQFKQVLSLCETESSRSTSLALAAKQARGKEKAGEVDPVEDSTSGLTRARRVGNAKPQAALLPWTGRGCFGISRSSWFKMRLLGMPSREGGGLCATAFWGCLCLRGRSVW